MEGVQPTISQVNVKQLLEDIITIYQELALKKEVYFDLKILTQSTHLDTDREILHLVLRNLVHNALKYTPLSSTVTLEIDENLQGEKIIRIKDQGEGISDEVQAQLLSSFVASQVGTDKEKGTGLGLMLVKEFIDHLKGQVSIESIAHQGTTVEIKLPLRQ